LSKKKPVTNPRQEGLVIDSSVAIAWCFPDEQDTYSQSVLDALAADQAIVPDLWHLEVANTLLVGERRKRSTQANTVTWFGFLTSLPIAVDEQTKAHAFGATLSLAREHNLSVYDAAYLELALRRDLPLATLDEKLKTAAEAVGVPLFVGKTHDRVRP
jgi:predicted nucleic acid-binding protein